MSTRPEKDERHAPVQIRQLPTGVPGLDEILGGGLPEYSFNIIAGAPGSGKTTLAHQIMFANASKDRPALYFTVLGEPAIKMLRYQQQFSFFDMSKIDGAIRFVNLSQIVLDSDLGAVLDAIIKEVENAYASIVVVDSFRTVVRRAVRPASPAPPKWSSRASSSAWPCTSPVGRPLRSWSASTSKMSCATTRSSPSPTACSGSIRPSSATRSSARCRS